MATGNKFILFFLLVIGGLLILCGTALNWSVEDDLLAGTNREYKHLFRYSQLLFWFAWFAALADTIFPNACFTAIQAAIIFCIVARRSGDGLASFSSVDTCRIQAERTSGDTKNAFQRCAAGGVLSYFGLVLSWLVSLPRLHFAKLDIVETIAIAAGSVISIIGAIVLWTSDKIDLGSPVRDELFDASMYAVFTVIFGFSAFLSDMVAVISGIAFYLTWVSASQLALMFFVVSQVSLTQNQENTIYAGFSMVWLGAIIMLVMCATRLMHTGDGDGVVHDDNAADAPRVAKTKPAEKV
ncbi:uncharacterized protein MONBRDRAFT_24390 [Monosiga brevicollis MX1]|uniref:Uncharacterized protein n=1 Tax=Monosiga brevicollis TaxID=81824 RepID=A9UW98_MONBE|nr:uncharacterized protein MONBRDRAFT_24390 [Monosiga brevicollis MX1]EDQ90727.1 predicted protein [Monosiga brevicollis MX1]|eukprot:XP_001744778.1 hypothetical protein [Monosiga brevicollis MX1]